MQKFDPKHDSTHPIYGLFWFGFYAMSTNVSYLMPNPILFIETVLFQTIPFISSTQFSSI